MKMAVGCDLTYEVGSTTTFIFNVAVADIPQHLQLVENWTIEPPLDAWTTVAGLNNRYTRIVAPAGTLRLRYDASLDLQLTRTDPHTIEETGISHLPLEVFPLLLPSRFCPSDLLTQTAERLFANQPPGHSRVTAICNWIYDNIAYQPGTSDPTTSASDTLERRAGVCRDFAHLAIAFCRAMNIPARLVSCYAAALQPPDFHAVFEAYLDGRWWLFDPTRQAKLDAIVRIGAGRDAAEVSFASFFGEAQMTGMQVWAEPADLAVLEDRPVAAVA
jgi:transglutaminase-like putative cysteine protease